MWLMTGFLRGLNSITQYVKTNMRLHWGRIVYYTIIFYEH